MKIMHIPFLWLSIGLMTGILSFYYGGPRAPFWLLGLSILSGLAAACLRTRWTVLIAAITALAALSAFYAHLRLSPVDSDWDQWTASRLSGQSSLWSEVEGIVTGVPVIKRKGKKEKVQFSLSASRMIPAASSGKIFNGEHEKIQVFVYQPHQRIMPGDHIRLRGRIKKARAALNPGQFDYRKFLREQDIEYLLECYGGQSVQILMKDPWSMRAVVGRARMYLRERIEKLYPGQEGKILVSVIAGMRDGVPYDLREAFAKTGTAHLLAISGLHLTLIAGSAYYLLIFLSIRQRAAAALALCAAALYAVLSGWGVPIQRAFLMAGVIFAGIILEREVHMLNLFFFAFFITLIQNPAYFKSISFQMSFLSVFSMIWLLPRLGALKKHKYSLLTNTTGVVLAGTFPVISYYFHTFSFVSLIANLLVIPLFHGVLLTGLLSLVFAPAAFLSGPLTSVCSVLLNGTLKAVVFLADLPHSFIYLQAPSAAAMTLYYGFMVSFLGLQKYQGVLIRRIRAVFFGGWIISAAFMFVPSARPDFSLTFFAGGNNTMVYTQFLTQQRWLLNTGRASQGHQARWILVPFFKEMGINHLSGIILSGLQKKYTGGIEEIDSHLKVKKLFYPLSKDRHLNAGKYKSIRIHPVSGNRRIAGDEEIGIDAVAVIDGEAVLNIRYRKLNFLILPNIKKRTLEYVYQLKDRFAEPELLYVSGRRHDYETMNEKIPVTAGLKPHLIIFYDCKAPHLSRTGAPLFLCLSHSGALTYTSSKVHGKTMLSAGSFTGGELFMRPLAEGVA